MADINGIVNDGVYAILGEITQRASYFGFEFGPKSCEGNSGNNGESVKDYLVRFHTFRRSDGCILDIFHFAINRSYSVVQGLVHEVVVVPKLPDGVQNEPSSRVVCI